MKFFFAQVLAPVLSLMLFSIAPQVQADSSHGFKSHADEQNYFTVKSVEIKEAPASMNPAAVRMVGHMNQLLLQTDSVPGGFIRSVIPMMGTTGEIQAWITLGERIWKIIVANRPVTNVTTQRVSVLPVAEQNWVAMDEWQGPVSKTYVVEAKNLYGMSVIKHAYTIAFNYGGKYQGKGQYLANATIIPSKVAVAWGYTLNSKVEVADTVNMGTKENPIPGVELQLQYSIDTVMKHAEARAGYFVRGDGQVVNITP